MVGEGKKKADNVSIMFIMYQEISKHLTYMKSFSSHNHTMR